MAVITSTECTLPRPDIGELQSAIATELSKRLLGGAPVLPMSAEDVLAFVMAGTVNLMFGAVTQALKENDPATMCCDNLVVYGAAHGINLKASTRSKGYVAITGTPNAPIPSFIRFVATNSREYKLDPATTTNPVMLDATGRAALRVVSIAPGAVEDVAAGTVLTVSTTIPDIDFSATVVGSGIIGGSDNETCESLRRRVIAAEASGAVVTNLQWYLSETLSYPGVTRVCNEACNECCDPTKLELYPFMEGVYGDAFTAPYGVPPQAIIDEMNLWMFGPNPGKGEGLAPMGTRGSYQAAIPSTLNVRACCFVGCADNARDQIIAGLRTFIRANYCVGSKVCKQQIIAATLAAVGPGPCFSEIQLNFVDIAGEDAAFAYLPCGNFLVLGDVELVEGPCT